MPSRILLLLTVMTLSLVACKPSKEKVQSSITEAEDALKKSYAAGKPEQQNVMNTINAYENFVKYYPKDSMAPVYLMKAGDCYRIIKEYNKAITEYQKVGKDYQDSKVYPNSVFVQGFVYENEIKDLPKAKERYEAFVKQFPNDPLTSSAQFSLQNLGVSPEDLVKRFEQQQNANADTANTAPAADKQ